MRIALLIDLPPHAPYHRATVEAIGHGSDALGLFPDLRVWETASPSLRSDLRDVDGIVIGPGSPYQDEHAVWEAVRTAREKGIPLVGT